MRYDLLTKRRKRRRGPRGEAAYVASGSEYDGSNDRGVFGGDITNLTDSKEGTFASWLVADTSASMRFITCGDGSTVDRFYIEKQIDNTIRIFARHLNGNQVMNLVTTETLTTGTPQHVFATWDINTSSAEIYLNGSLATLATEAYSNATADYTGGDATVGGTFPGTSLWDGCLSEFWLNNTYHPGGVSKFIVDGAPVSLGADGSEPFNSPPALYAPNGDPSNNAGSGQNATIVGGLTVCADEIRIA